MKLKIAYFPKPSDKNSYTIRMKGLLENFGSVFPLSPKNIKSVIYSRRKFDITIFNWLENKCFSKEGRLKFSLLFFSLIWFHIMRMFSHKLVYVRHNIYPHNIQNERAKHFSIRIIEYLEKKSDCTIVHSSTQCDGKRIYIPHPLYNIKNGLKEKDDLQNKYFVCFGRIERYKKLDSLIKNWPEDLTLIIAGSPDDNSHVEELRSIINDRDIKIIDKFLSDEEAYELVKNAYYSILPSNSESMIVSGSFFFSISAGTPVIAVTSEFYNSLDDRGDDLILIDDICHIGKLLSSLKHKKTKLRSSFTEQFSDEKIVESLSNLFVKLTKK